MSERIGKSTEVRFAQFAAQETFDSLPPAVVTRTKEIFLDTMGIMVRATSAPGLSNLRRALVTGNSGASTVFGTKFK